MMVVYCGTPYRGFDPDGETEADYFGNCPVCGRCSTRAISGRC